MTARDLYINLLNREPDPGITAIHGCTRRLGVIEFTYLKKQIQQSDEYLSRGISPCPATVAAIRRLYADATIGGNVDGDGVLHYARLVDYGTLLLDDVKKRIEHGAAQQDASAIQCDKRLGEDTVAWPPRATREAVNSARYAHLVGRYTPAPDDAWRVRAAVATWSANYCDDLVPCHVDSFCEVPTLHSLVDACIREYSLAPWQAIVYTNADILLCREFAEALRMTSLPAFSYRRDVAAQSAPPTVPTQEWIMENGAWFSGADLFVFTVGWWEQHRAELPDMYVGRPYWDLVLRHFVMRTCRRGCCKGQPAVCSEIARPHDIPGINLHISHRNRGFENGRLKDHNYSRAVHYFSKHGICTDFIF